MILLPVVLAQCPHITDSDVEFLGLENFRQLLNTDSKNCPSSDEVLTQGKKYKRTQRKVYGVGLSKTGTTSLHNALTLAGFRNTDMAANLWTEFVDKIEDPTAFWDPGRSSDEVQERWQRYFKDRDSTTDLPTALFYEEALAAFPSALFVLTTRPLEAWARSAHSQFASGVRSPALLRNRREAYGSTTFDPFFWRKHFLEHYVDVLRTVPCCQLLVMSVFHDRGWDRLAPFLHLEPVPDVPFPWVDPRRRQRSRQTAMKVRALFDKLDTDRNTRVTFDDIWPFLLAHNVTKQGAQRQFDRVAVVMPDTNGLDFDAFMRYLSRLDLP